MFVFVNQYIFDLLVFFTQKYTHDRFKKSQSSLYNVKFMNMVCRWWRQEISIDGFVS